MSGDVLEVARDHFRQKDPVLMARYAGAAVDAGGQRLQLTYCGQPATVSYPSLEIAWAGGQLDTNEEVLLLQYLAGASGLPLRHHWVAFLELPGGPHHDRLFREEAHAPLAACFGHRPRALLEAGAAYRARPAAFGDAACVLPALPRVPLLCIVWGAHTEAGARATVLFDASAPGYLTTAALWVLGIAVARRLVAAAPPPGL